MTDPISNERLLPCPFCGGKSECSYNGPTPEQAARARAWGDDVDWQFYGECTHCGATGPGCQSKTEAIAAWNRRQSPAGVEVKTLEWREIEVARSDEDPNTEPTGDYEAETAFGPYYIAMYFGSDSYGWEVQFDAEAISDHDSPEAAKAAAQADYERRILSALSVKEPEGVEPVGVSSRLRIVRAHKSTCASVQPGSSHFDKCDCGALDTAGEAIDLPPPKAVIITDEMVGRVFNAAWDCPHSIDGSAVTLRIDPAKPGNALSQLHQRLRAALSSEAHNGREAE